MLRALGQHVLVLVPQIEFAYEEHMCECENRSFDCNDLIKILLNI